MRFSLLAGLLVSTGAVAQSPVTLDARAAESIVHGCATHAIAKHQSHAIAIVDAGGHLVAALRMDGNGSAIMDFSIAKAEAVAAWGFSTAQMEQNAKEAPGFAFAPHVVTVPGGVPIWSSDGKTRIGAVGVSGEAPADDTACAEAGIREAGLRSSRG